MRNAWTPGCTVPLSVSPRLAFTFGLSASKQLRARLKYSRAGAPATSTSGVVKKRHEAERDATCERRQRCEAGKGRRAHRHDVW